MNKHSNKHDKHMSVYFGTLQIKRGSFWRGGIGFLGLNGPGVTVTNSTDFIIFFFFFLTIMNRLKRGNILFQQVACRIWP